VLVTRPVVEASGPHLEFERIGEVSLKGSRSRPSSSSPAPRRGLSVLLERVRAGGLLAPGEPVVVMLSGGARLGVPLDVAVALAGRRR
jgi:hypothetical protein